MFSTVSSLLQQEYQQQQHHQNYQQVSPIDEFDIDYWKTSFEDDLFNSPLTFDASETGLWNGRFVPPPPRPPFIDDTIPTDGLTTCDLCTWAIQEKNAFSLEGSIGTCVAKQEFCVSFILAIIFIFILFNVSNFFFFSVEAAGELGWAFTIAIVSVISALIGAIIMITLVRCKRSVLILSLLLFFICAGNSKGKFCTLYLFYDAH